MYVLEHCEPKAVFRFFEQLCAIPHGSGNTRAISDFCVAFAKERGLDCTQDGANNVVIRKNASPGYEGAPAVILQGHLDMVCAKEPELTFDFKKDGLSLTVDGDFVRANGTSLGGDNGIAVAMALAILDDDTLAHPPLEALFTVDEEVGLEGAKALDPALLRGRFLLNLDSEVEGVLTAGCAGGLRADCTLPIHRAPAAGVRCTLTIDGLLGGHSGVEIDKERGNSNLLMGRLLLAMRQVAPFGLCALSGGFADNAIARKTEAVLLLPADHLAALQAVVAQYQGVYSHEYAASDPAVRVALSVGGDAAADAADDESLQRVLFVLFQAPNGVQNRSMTLPGLVQTSLNLGILEMADDAVCFSFSVRSSLPTQKELLRQRLCSLLAQMGGSVSCRGEYPAWEFQQDSALRELVVRCYTQLYGAAPQVTATHGGLECGILSDKMPGLDSVSFGPNLYDVHSSQEHLSISSTARTYALVLEILRQAGQLS